MYGISKEFYFSASHQLSGLPADHPCSRLHGHNYRVRIELKSNRLNAADFVRDYRELNDFKRYLDDQIDHRHLNDIFEVTTAEALAQQFYFWTKSRWPEVNAVGVSETNKTWAWYYESE